MKNRKLFKWLNFLNFNYLFFSWFKKYMYVKNSFGIISTALSSLIGNSGKCLRVVGILEMLEKRGRYL